MGAYDSPDVNVGIDRDSGQMIGKGIASIGQQIGGAVAAGAEKEAAAQKEFDERKRKEAEKERIRAEENWRIHKEVESQKTQAVINWQTTMKANNIDMGSLDVSFNGIIDNLYAAKDRLGQSRGDYEGRKDDEAIIRNSQAFISNAGERFATVNALTSEYKEKVRMMGKPGGIDPQSTDPRFAAMMLIGDGNGQGLNGGSIGWESRTGPGGRIQMFQVAESDKIQEANWIEAGKEGNVEDYSRKYELSYEEVSSFFDDADNNPNTFGPFSIIQDDSALMKKAAQTAGIIDENGKVNPGDPAQPGSGYIIKGDKTPMSDNVGSWVEEKTWPNTKKIVGNLKQEAIANAEADLGWSASQATANSNIRANAEPRTIKIDGVETTEYFVPQYGRLEDGAMIYREPDGTLIKGDDLILGNDIDGLMSQGNEDGTAETYGYNKDEYDKYLKFSEYRYNSTNNAFSDVSSLPAEQRQYDVKWTEAERAARNTVTSGDSDTSGLNEVETTIYTRLVDGDTGFTDFFKENTNNASGQISEDGKEFTFKDGNNDTQTINLENEQQVIGLLKQMLKEEKGLGTGKQRDAAIFKIAEKLRKDKFGEEKVEEEVEGEQKEPGALNDL